jgi:TrmH family RNA methyltransferase
VYVSEGEAVVGIDEPVVVAPGVLERVATTITPRPMIAVGEQRVASLDSLKGATFVVVVDGVADPGNLGTILRTAEAAGAEALVVAGGVDVFNPKAVRASAGALFFLPVAVVADAARALEEIGAWGMRRVGASADGPVPYHSIDLREPIALVLGNESHGLGPAVAARLDDIVAIPMTGRSESLNVAAAAAVLCFEVARQRGAS